MAESTKEKIFSWFWLDASFITYVEFNQNIRSVLDDLVEVGRSQLDNIRLGCNKADNRQEDGQNKNVLELHYE